MQGRPQEGQVAEEAGRHAHPALPHEGCDWKDQLGQVFRQQVPQLVSRLQWNQVC